MPPGIHVPLGVCAPSVPSAVADTLVPNGTKTTSPVFDKVQFDI
ncbi:MAG: hypothetical protein V7K89_09965 [Nostoc sp.]